LAPKNDITIFNAETVLVEGGQLHLELLYSSHTPGIGDTAFSPDG
jgi:hypothetical protein